MKLLIASDIHGSVYYMDLLMNRIKEEKPDRIIMLGDFLYHGPRNDLPKDYNPKKVIEMLNSLDGIIAVRGNCDAEVDQMVLNFPLMADYKCIDVDGISFYLSHGHIYNQDNPIKGIKDVLLCGHTHVPGYIEKDNFVYINSGSVSIPKNDSCNSYLVYENKEFKFKRVDDGQIFNTYVLP